MVVAFDLDDTLFRERDFLVSAQRGIARQLAEKYCFNPSELTRFIDGGPNTFDRFHEWLNQNRPEATEDIPWMVAAYRCHRPTDLRLDVSTVAVLDELTTQGHTLVIITDGRSVTQRAKVVALGLERWFKPENIFISEEIGGDKLSGIAFRSVTQRFTGQRCWYIADNPTKDFVWPRRLGWRSVMLRDNGRNIHPQPMNISPQYRADLTIDSLDILPSLIHC